MKLKKYKLIFLLVVFMVGLSITGWSISTHYDHTFINAEFQKELKNNSQIGNTTWGDFSKNSPILFLISTGLIGLLGVRRQRKKLGTNSPPQWNKCNRDFIGQAEIAESAPVKSATLVFFEEFNGVNRGQRSVVGDQRTDRTKDSPPNKRRIKRWEKSCRLNLDYNCNLMVIT